MIKLAVAKRDSKTKKDVKAIRRAGEIPAVLYSPQMSPEKLTVEGEGFSTILREMPSGRLPTTVFVLSDGKTERRAIVKDIQYHLTTYAVSHIDFEELVENVPVRVKVPVSCVGVVDCTGIKLGGFLRQVVRHVKVECLPKDIPSEFVVDVRDLGIRQSRRLKDIKVPSHVRPLTNLEEVLVVIAKR